MRLWSAAFLGIVQGLTEFLPVSSTAHLLLVGDAIGFSDPGGVFTVMIQFGAILALMTLYRQKLWSVVRGLPSEPDARRFALMLVLAVIPAVVAGVVFEDHVRKVLYDSPAVIAVAFIVGGVVMLAVERYRPVPVVTDAAETPVARAVAIGACQSLALIPGVSRSGATIVGGLLLRLDRRAAAEFSFFLAMPTIGGAFAKDLIEKREMILASPDRAVEIGVGFVMAFVAALLVVRPFLNLVSRIGFGPFAWYRIVAGLVILGARAAGFV